MRIFACGRRAAVALALLGTLAGITACGSAQAKQAAAPSSGHLSAHDVGWLNQANQANQAETAAGQLAESNAATAAIRSVGATLARDQTTLEAKLLQIVARLKVDLVQYLTVQQTETNDRLAKEFGSMFDHDFTASMMTAVQAMIAATEAETRHGSSHVVLALARQMLPVLERHLKMLRAVAGSG